MAGLQVAAVYMVAILQERDLELDPPDMLPVPEHSGNSLVAAATSVAPLSPTRLASPLLAALTPPLVS